MIRNHLEDVNECLVMGHIYANLLVIRCGHREGVTLRGSVHRDYEDGSTDWIWEREVEFGPFDDARTVMTGASELTEMIVRVLQIQPGSL